MGPFLFKLLEVALQKYKETLLATTLLLRPQSIPQKQPAHVHNFFNHFSKPQTISCEAFHIRSRGEEVSLVLPPKPPHVHTTMDCKPAHSGRREAGYHSSKNLPEIFAPPPHHMPYGLSVLSRQSNQTMLTLWFGAGTSQVETIWQQLQWSMVEPV